MEQHDKSRLSRVTIVALSLVLVQLSACGEDDKSAKVTQYSDKVSAAVIANGKMGSKNSPRKNHMQEKDEDTNLPPRILNQPAERIEVGDTYVFQADVEDPDDDEIGYRIANRPSWMSWNKATGRLRGTPDSIDVGPYPDISIFVSDGTVESRIGPFTVTVTQEEVVDDPPPTAQRKFNPGHYISVNRWDDQGHMIEALKPGVTGLQKRYTWRSVEPTINNYDFSEVKSDLDLLASQGSRMIVFLEDKSFNGKFPTPPYLQNNHTLANRNGGYTAKRWHPYVIERFKALVAALGSRFDSHPAFEGVAIQESSLSLNQNVLDANGYTPEFYRDALIEVLTSARASCPTSQVFWYMNFLPGNQSYIANIANAIATSDIAMGGPDVLPDEHALQTHAYPYYSDFKDKLTLFNSMQFDSYSHVHKDSSYPTKYWTMNELFQFAKSELNVQYLFWNRLVKSSPADSYNWTNALPVINATANFGHQN